MSKHTEVGRRRRACLCAFEADGRDSTWDPVALELAVAAGITSVRFKKLMSDPYRSSGGRQGSSRCSDTHARAALRRFFPFGGPPSTLGVSQTCALVEATICAPSGCCDMGATPRERGGSGMSGGGRAGVERFRKS